MGGYVLTFWLKNKLSIISNKNNILAIKQIHKKTYADFDKKSLFNHSLKVMISYCIHKHSIYSLLEKRIKEVKHYIYNDLLNNDGGIFWHWVKKLFEKFH